MTPFPVTADPSLDALEEEEEEQEEEEEEEEEMYDVWFMIITVFSRINTHFE